MERRMLLAFLFFFFFKKKKNDFIGGNSLRSRVFDFLFFWEKSGGRWGVNRGGLSVAYGFRA